MTDDPLNPTEFDLFADKLGKRQRKDTQGDPATGVLGMWIFLISLSILFLASLVGVIVVRLRADVWRPEGAASLPWTLVLSTAILLASSGTIHRALRSVRSGRQETLARMLASTLLLGVVFLVLQAVNWVQLVFAGVGMKTGLYAFTFYVLTALHAAHVIGGIIPLTVITLRASRGRYGPDFHSGVRYITMYWHFLDAVWIVLCLLLVLV